MEHLHTLHTKFGYSCTFRKTCKILAHSNDLIAVGTSTKKEMFYSMSIFIEQSSLLYTESCLGSNLHTFWMGVQWKCFCLVRMHLLYLLRSVTPSKHLVLLLESRFHFMPQCLCICCLAHLLTQSQSVRLWCSCCCQPLCLFESSRLLFLNAFWMSGCSSVCICYFDGELKSVVQNRIS